MKDAQDSGRDVKFTGEYVYPKRERWSGMKDALFIFACALLLAVAIGFGAAMVKLGPAVGEALAGFVGGLAGACR